MLEGWRHTELGEHIDLLTGHPFKSAEYSQDSDGIRLLRGDNVIQGVIRWDDARRWPRDKVDGLERYQLAEGDVVVALDRTWVKAGLKAAAITRGDLPCMLVQRVARIRAADTLDQRFLAAIIQSHRFVEMVKSSKTETAVPHISPNDIREFVIDLPPLPEQRKIAEILRTWDEALEKLTALRAAKARRLAGVGRALLARAADDPATVTKPLATLTRIVKGQQLNKLDISDGDYPVWNGGITPSGFHNEWNTEGGTITISEGGNSCGFVNLAHQPFWLGGHCYALQGLSPIVERDFLFHTLKSREPEIMRLRVGSGLPNIQRADLERLTVVVPPRDLQEKIASALTAGNAEIALLGDEIEALTRQKRGLMQKLLTGEWRVKPEAPVA
ncbi:restriction endonuclease subunit S [Ruixingdingia sedimenti]|uniref:Restriction endonuclease subunit S n=1 Tax=Ruixingdingia sedimenti TaxID=3073604 RepID=A0ABU1F3G7_9RHOB|nr:restriction endonuclease subunit S [Xinfangfangia sp. LG-4]MDR5651424.1 restriction endonuclease subunit S [Xinfangfangia sp. LG-4]